MKISNVAPHVTPSRDYERYLRPREELRFNLPVVREPDWARKVIDALVQGLEKLRTLLEQLKPNASSATGHPISTSSGINQRLTPDAQGNVSEEQLFAAVLAEQVKIIKGAEVGAKFDQLLEASKQQLAGKGGYIPYEDAARLALKQLRDSGTISASDAEQLHAQAFYAAQLDADESALFDHIGDTSATSGVEAAVKRAESRLAVVTANPKLAALRQIDLGFDAVGNPIPNPYLTSGGATKSSVSTPPSGVSRVVEPRGTRIDGPDGFLWKPISEKGNFAVILLPPEMDQRVDSVVIKDRAGKVIEQGIHPIPAERPDGPMRMKYVFKRRGAAYPENMTVEVRLKDGSVVEYRIPKPGRRHD